MGGLRSPPRRRQARPAPQHACTSVRRHCRVIHLGKGASGVRDTYIVLQPIQHGEGQCDWS